MAATSCSTTTGASPSDGSSMSRTVGLVTSARAIASICCSPPDRCAPRLSRRPASDGNSSSTAASDQSPGPGSDRQVLLHGETAEHLALLRHVADARARSLVDRQPADVAATDDESRRTAAEPVRRSARATWSCPRRCGRRRRPSRRQPTERLSRSTMVVGPQPPVRPTISSTVRLAGETRLAGRAEIHRAHLGRRHHIGGRSRT